MRILLLLLLVASAFAFVLQRGTYMGVDQGATERLRYHAIPVAIAALYHGYPHDYTSRMFIAHPFQDVQVPIDERILEVIEAKAPDDPEIYFWAADDRGMADYVIAAFKLFGPQVSSLYDFYFVLLLFSSLAFVLAYWHKKEMLCLLVFVLAGIATVVSVLPLVNHTLTEVGDPLSLPQVGLFESRIFDVLAYIAVLHVALFVAKTERLSILAALALLFQVSLFLFCYHARSSLGWELVAMVLLNVYFSVKYLRGGGDLDDRGKIAAYGFAAFPVALLVGGLIALNVYKHQTYHPQYFQEMGARTFWHNALMGLGADRVLSRKYALQVDDRMVVDAVVKYVTEHQLLAPSEKWETQEILNSLGGATVFDWAKYEQYAKKLYFDIVATHPFRVLVVYALKKPLNALKLVISTVRAKGKPSMVEFRKRHGIFFNPFAWPLIVVVAMAMFLAGRRLVEPGPETTAVIVLLACSLIPSVAFYPAVLTLGGTFVSLTVLAYLLIPPMLYQLWLARPQGGFFGPLMIK